MKFHFPSHLLYGADYNPEQWPETVWQEDMRLMKLAHVNMVSINIFSWAALEPRPNEYHFETLDRIMTMLAEHDIAIDLATATASPPTWMSRLYPAMLPVTWDGKRLGPGSRQHYCPNSLDYRREAASLVQQLATRYRQHPGLSIWHVNNEYGDHVSSCYCDRCAAAFRIWLQARYSTLDALNDACYIATQGSSDLLDKLTSLLFQEAAVHAIMKAPEGVEVTRRIKANGQEVYFLLNHADNSEQVALPAGTFTSLLRDDEVSNSITIPARDIVVLLAQVPGSDQRR
jgi:beta-galactosidase GanA